MIVELRTVGNELEQRRVTFGEQTLKESIGRHGAGDGFSDLACAFEHPAVFALGSHR